MSRRAIEGFDMLANEMISLKLERIREGRDPVSKLALVSIYRIRRPDLPLQIER